MAVNELSSMSLIIGRDGQECIFGVCTFVDIMKYNYVYFASCRCRESSGLT